MRNSRNTYVIFLVSVCGTMNLINGSLLSSLLQPSYCFIAPKVCPNVNVTFYLYTSSNDSLVLSVSNPNSIRNAPFKRGPIKILIHGYTAGRDETPNMEIRPAYLQSRKEVNVISMDYAPLVQNGCYVHAVPNTGVAANCTAQFIENLLKLRSDVELSQIHLIGHSLGAQVAGQVSSFLRVGRIERITALDAALPLYLQALTPNFKEINRGDAKFVDAVHTNSGLAGQSLPYDADIDFYANNGVFQPGCGFLNLVCDHARSAVYYAESINSQTGFTAYKCSGPPPYAWGRCFKKDGPTELFGEYVNPNYFSADCDWWHTYHRHSHQRINCKWAKGIYAFRTASESPYALPVPLQGGRRKPPKKRMRRLTFYRKNKKHSNDKGN